MDFVYNINNLTISINEINFLKSIIMQTINDEFSHILPFINECCISNSCPKQSLGGGHIVYDHSKTFYYSLWFDESIISNNRKHLINVIKHELYHCNDFYYFYLRIDDFDKAFFYLIFDEFKNIEHFKKSFCTIFWSEYYAYRNANLDNVYSLNNLNASIDDFGKSLTLYFNELKNHSNICMAENYNTLIKIGIKGLIYTIFKELGCRNYFNNFDPPYKNPQTIIENWVNEIHSKLNILFNSFYDDKLFTNYYNEYINLFYEIFAHYNLQFLCSSGQPSLQIVT